MYYFDFISGKPYPPGNLRIFILEYSVNITWTIEKPARGVNICILDGDKKNLDCKDIHSQNLSFETTALTPCEEYTVMAKSFDGGGWSDYVQKKFWFTGKTHARQDSEFQC